jgi:hypothetical protein
MRGQMRVFGTTVACVALSAFAFAQSLFDGFEAYNPNSPINGQGAWFNPGGSLDWFVYGYGSNPLGIAPNPNGQNQMIAARKEGTLFPRTQRDFNWSARETWLISYDVYVGFDPTVGDGYNYDNIGSFSLQPSVSAQYFIDLFQWVTPTTEVQLGNPNDGWRATWVVGRLDDPDAHPSRGDGLSSISLGPPSMGFRLTNGIVALLRSPLTVPIFVANLHRFWSKSAFATSTQVKRMLRLCSPHKVSNFGT